MNDNLVKSFRPTVHRILFPLALIFTAPNSWALARSGEAGRIVLTGEGDGDGGDKLGWDGVLTEHLTSLQSDGVPSNGDDDFVVEDIGFQPVGSGYFGSASGTSGAKLVSVPSGGSNSERTMPEFAVLRDTLVQNVFRTALLGFKDRNSSKCSVTLGTLIQYASGMGAYGVKDQGTVSIPTAASRTSQIADSVAGLRLPGKAVKDRIGFYVELAPIPKILDAATTPGGGTDPHPADGSSLVVPILCTLRGHYESDASDGDAAFSDDARRAMKAAS